MMKIMINVKPSMSFVKYARKMFHGYSIGEIQMNEMKLNQKRYALDIPKASTLEEVIHVLNNLSLEYTGDLKDKQFKQLEKYLAEISEKKDD